MSLFDELTPGDDTLVALAYAEDSKNLNTETPQYLTLLTERLLIRSQELNQVGYRLAKALGYNEVDGVVDLGKETIDDLLKSVEYKYEWGYLDNDTH